MQADDYDDIGRYLRDVRESLKVTVEQAARDLHIRPKYLHDLERGDLSALPGKAYIRGYVKNYAEYLRLDAQDVLATYEQLFGGSHAQKFFVPNAHTHQQVPSRGIIWLGLLGIVGVYGYWYFGIHEHAAVPLSTVEETKLEQETQMPDDWSACLDSSDASCFLDMSGVKRLPDMKPPAVILPEMPAVNVQAGPVKDADKAQ